MATYTESQQRELDQKSGHDLDKHSTTKRASNEARGTQAMWTVSYFQGTTYCGWVTGTKTSNEALARKWAARCNAEYPYHNGHYCAYFLKRLTP